MATTGNKAKGRRSSHKKSYYGTVQPRRTLNNALHRARRRIKIIGEAAVRKEHSNGGPFAPLAKAA